MQERAHRKLFGIGALVALYGFFVGCGWIGIDFGRHWDERFNVLDRVQYSLEHRTLLPHWYEFPSLLHEMSLAALAPDAAVEFLRGHDEIRATLIRTVNTRAFLFRMRMVCCAITGLTAVWLFILITELGRPLAEALATAAIAASSWELQYHSRWLTADPIVTQFGALTLMLVVLGHHRRSPFLLAAGGAAAGLACGTKYPAGALIVPVLVACAMLPRQRFRSASFAVVAAVIAFVVSTPAILIDPQAIASDLAYQISVYSTHLPRFRPYLVNPPFESSLRMLEYSALALPSHYLPIALSISAVAVIGTLVLIRRDFRLAVLVLSFPLVYAGYFATRKMMVARNLLVLLPFIAFLTAEGMSWLAAHLHARSVRKLAMAAVAILILVNLSWLLAAARSITVRDGRVFLRQFNEYVAGHPAVHYSISPAVRAALSAMSQPVPVSEPLSSPAIEKIVFFAHEAPPDAILANRWNALTWFGPQEVNFNYYPSWRANDRIVMLSRDQLPAARKTGRPDLP